ncbi:MAG TPA: bifunctional oligoribonuclease/PAP phosphatase NrnA [Bacillota bacterium]
MNSGEYNQIIDFLQTHDRFILGCHINPDGDAIGSLLALGLSLQMAGKQVKMLLPEGIPASFRFLDGVELISPTLSPGFSQAMVICVDCAEKSRLNAPPELLQDKARFPLVVNIDHHISNDSFGDLNLVRPHASATGEIVYRLLTAGGFPMDKRVATAIYTAIATDTGFFRYSNTSGEALYIAAQLVQEYQVAPAFISERVHEEKSYESLKLLGEVLSTLELSKDRKVSWMKIDQALLAKYPVELEETDGFVTYANSIQGVMVGLLFKEVKPNEVKISWRSKEPVDVSVLAAHFGGGGHARAAGCTIGGVLEDIVEQVLAHVEEYVQESEKAERNLAEAGR